MSWSLPAPRGTSPAPTRARIAQVVQSYPVLVAKTWKRLSLLERGALSSSSLVAITTWLIAELSPAEIRERVAVIGPLMVGVLWCSILIECNLLYYRAARRCRRWMDYRDLLATEVSRGLPEPISHP